MKISLTPQARGGALVRLSLSLPILGFCLVLLSGCSGVNQSTSTARHPAGLGGSVHGGQQPIAGATIQLYAVGTAGDGSAATPLLTSPVTTDASGSFSVSGYTCPTPATLVYLVAKGGNPGLPSSVNNTSLALMAALGQCGNLASSSFVAVNEVTTVAAVFPLSPYMVSASGVGSQASDASALAQGFLVASELVNISVGSAPGQNVPAGQAVPVTEINTLADVIASCVNSSGGVAGDGSACGQLFTLTTLPNQAAPTDTVTSLLNLAKDPTLNTAAVFNLVAPIAPFGDTLVAAPANFDLTLTATGLTESSSTLNFPGQVVSSTSPAQGLTLTNNTPSNISISSASITGVNADDYAIVNLCAEALAPGASCSIMVTFDPAVQGSSNAILSVASTQGPAQPVTLAGSGMSAPSLPAFGTLISGNIVAAYDLTQAVAGESIADTTGDPSKSIPWPTTNPPIVTPQGLVFDGTTTACLNVPPSVAGAVGASIYNTKFGEDYADGITTQARLPHTLFAGTDVTSNIYSAVKFGTGIGAGSFYQPQIVDQWFEVETLQSALGSHMFTYIVDSSTATNQVGIDAHYVGSYLTQNTVAPLAAPYYIGCESTQGGHALGTLSYVIIWGSTPTPAQLQSTYSALSSLAEAKGINNNWGLPAAGTAPQVACIGDSHTVGVGATTWCSTNNMPALNQPYKLSVMATSGKFLSDMVPEVPYEMYKNVSATSPTKILVLDGGTNDIVSGSYSDIVPIYTQLQQAAASAHAAGIKYIQQTIFSMCLDNNGTSDSAAREALNTWIRANWKTYADGISDVGADPILGAAQASCTDTVNFDGTKYHLTTAGKAVEGLTPQAAINNLTGSTSASPTTINVSSTIQSGQNYIVASCDTACTLTLPMAYLNAGWGFTVESSGSGAVSVVGAGSDTINGQTSAVVVPAGSPATFISVANSDVAVAGASWTASF